MNMFSNIKKTILFGLSIILVLLLFFVYLLNFNLNSKYREVIEDELSTLDLIQKITSESINNYFTLRSIHTFNQDDQIENAKSFWIEHRDLTTSYIDSLSAFHSFKN